MATQITWIIEQMWVKPHEDGKTDVVITAAWRCNGTDGQYYGFSFQTQDFPLDQSSFTPYAELTEDQVLNWCYENGVDKNAQEAIVEQQIQAKTNPLIVIPPLPWA